MKMKRFIVVLAILIIAVQNVFAQKFNASTDVVRAKNIIILIADGQSVDVNTLTRWYKGGQSLAIDEMASGLIRTHNSDTPIADSAPSATAYATGHKSQTGYIGVLPDEATLPGSTKGGEIKRPVANILETARLLGKATGIIATSEIMHATPAAFSSHYPSRKDYDNLSEQQVYQNIDVILGGGYTFFKPQGRKDGKDLEKEFVRLGYTVVRNAGELGKVKSGKVWGAFAEKDMKYDFDRGADEPSLADMTKKAIEILSKDKDGFFLMVEGSKIDWAAHANDPIGMISDSLAFDAAVKVALDYAKKNGDTMVLAMTDHGNSGLTIGNRSTSSNYDKVKLSEFIEPLKKARLTAEAVAGTIEKGGDIKTIMRNSFGIADLTDEEIASIKGKKGDDLHYAIGPIMAERAKLGFTTNGHTGEDVVLYSYLPGNKRITGVLDNTDIAKYMALVIGSDLNAVTKRLFAGEEEIKKAGIKISSNGDTLTLTKGNNKAVVKKNNNTALINGSEKMLEGVAVYNGNKWYIPEELINAVK